MNIRIGLSAVLLLTLEACAGTDHSPAQAAPAWTSYTCADGRIVEATYPDSDTALIRIKGETHTLRVAISASGARYVGDGWQWWTKGMHDGMLAPLAADEGIASATSVDCHAP
jgi:membrane-bound inhibitor of C-type lysozyme